MTTKGFSDNYEFLVSDFAEKNHQEDLSFSTDKVLENIAALESQTDSLIEPYLYCDLPLSGDRELRILSPSTKVNIPAVKTGSGLNSHDDILIDPFFASSQGLNIGDSIGDGDKTFNIAGIMATPHYIYPLKYVNDVLPPSGFGISLVSAEVFDNYPEAETVYSVRFIDRNNINTQVSALRKLLEEEGYGFSDWMPSSDNKRIRMPWATISGAKAMSVPLPTAMFLLSCIIIGVMIWRMTRADSVIIGTFYAQGYRKKEMLRHYMALPVIVAALGGIVGVLAGLPLIRPLVVYMASSYYNVPFEGISIAFADIAVGILMPVVFVGLACYFVIN
ncbi:ABC transporter permease, partial [Tyzzerella sp. OttesenSCG-928-J15]|nr:ABC transporter permease [Tyzzerella sp. OttesenSCG-928-J15]